jgi:hypothetical protein
VLWTDSTAVLQWIPFNSMPHAETLWFGQPAISWNAAIPLGNGRSVRWSSKLRCADKNINLDLSLGIAKELDL